MPAPGGFTRFIVVQTDGGAVVPGRGLQQLFEIETRRLLALLAFPQAIESAAAVARLEAAAALVTDAGWVDADGELLTRLASLADQAEALAAENCFRFSAARAYRGLVQERIGQLNERALGDWPTIGPFMQRRLAPAMRTCIAGAERQQEVIARIARTAQMINTRVGVAAEATNLGLLASMDRRAHLQLRLEETVEGLSAAAIFQLRAGAVEICCGERGGLRSRTGFQHRDGVGAPVVIRLVWLFLRRIRRRIRGVSL